MIKLTTAKLACGGGLHERVKKNKKTGRKNVLNNGKTKKKIMPASIFDFGVWSEFRIFTLLAFNLKRIQVLNF
ncbi:hypothetical protein BpHYR1_014685 [Brachionus plicatilis]|uniref:Uncharacterized protein n=1 Tax=Brachionus plicatilis TaxID=10195 RepID=A0A3M7RHX8_BRAPC|nr:hypothetical protein BpHYR1_014685 [Brachionus plicatilis]